MRLKILTPLFDPFLRLLMREAEVKARLVAMMDLQDGEKVVDFGCGTGTLAIMLKEAVPGSEVMGIDVDPEVLEIARAKARQRKVDVLLEEYDGITLQFADCSIDKVVTSLVLHHLSTPEKYAAFKEIYRVLKKGGAFYILDFGLQKSLTMRALAWVAGHFEPIQDNLRGKIPQYLSEAGFTSVREMGSENTSFGSVSYYRSEKQ